MNIVAIWRDGGRMESISDIRKQSEFTGQDPENPKLPGGLLILGIINFLVAKMETRSSG